MTTQRGDFRPCVSIHLQTPSTLKPNLNDVNSCSSCNTTSDHRMVKPQTYTDPLLRPHSPAYTLAHLERPEQLQQLYHKQ